MTWDGRQVGFIDCEEGPLEVMDLEQAQAHDWLMFGYGVARYYEKRPQVLWAMLADAMEGADRPVAERAHEVAGRLWRLARLTRCAGKSGCALAGAIRIVHAATACGLVALAVLSLDWLADGELDLLVPLAWAGRDRPAYAPVQTSGGIHAYDAPLRCMQQMTA